MSTVTTATITDILSDDSDSDEAEGVLTPRHGTPPPQIFGPNAGPDVMKYASGVPMPPPSYDESQAAHARSDLAGSAPWPAVAERSQHHDQHHHRMHEHVHHMHAHGHHHHHHHGAPMQDVAAYNARMPPEHFMVPSRLPRTASETDTASTNASVGTGTTIVSTGPEGSLGASALLYQALSFINTLPPPQRGLKTGYTSPLTRVIAIPMLASPPPSMRVSQETGEVEGMRAYPIQFARLYARTLSTAAVTSAAQAAFLDGLNSVSRGAGWDGTTSLDASGTGITGLIEGGGNVPKREWVGAYIQRANSSFWAPRGLRAEIVSLAELAVLVGVPERNAFRDEFVQSVLKFIGKARSEQAELEEHAETEERDERALKWAEKVAGSMEPWTERLDRMIPARTLQAEEVDAVARGLEGFDLAERQRSQRLDEHGYPTDEKLHPQEANEAASSQDQTDSALSKFWTPFGLAPISVGPIWPPRFPPSQPQVPVTGEQVHGIIGAPAGSVPDLSIHAPPPLIHHPTDPGPPLHAQDPSFRGHDPNHRMGPFGDHGPFGRGAWPQRGAMGPGGPPRFGPQRGFGPFGSGPIAGRGPFGGGPPNGLDQLGRANTFAGGPPFASGSNKATIGTHNWAEDWGRRMEKWGVDYGKRWQDWGVEYGKAWQEWGNMHDRKWNKSSDKIPKKFGSSPASSCPVSARNQAGGVGDGPGGWSRESFTSFGSGSTNTALSGRTPTHKGKERKLEDNEDWYDDDDDTSSVTSMSSVSSMSSSSSDDSTLREDPEAMFAAKVMELEAFAAKARAKGHKDSRSINKELETGLRKAEQKKTNDIVKIDRRIRKRELDRASKELKYEYKIKTKELKYKYKTFKKKAKKASHKRQKFEILQVAMMEVVKDVAMLKTEYGRQRAEINAATSMTGEGDMAPEARRALYKAQHIERKENRSMRRQEKKRERQELKEARKREHAERREAKRLRREQRTSDEGERRGGRGGRGRGGRGGRRGRRESVSSSSSSSDSESEDDRRCGGRGRRGGRGGREGRGGRARFVGNEERMESDHKITDQNMLFLVIRNLD
jgi:hypothetical protein